MEPFACCFMLSWWGKTNTREREREREGNNAEPKVGHSILSRKTRLMEHVVWMSQPRNSYVCVFLFHFLFVPFFLLFEGKKSLESKEVARELFCRGHLAMVAGPEKVSQRPDLVEHVTRLEVAPGGTINKTKGKQWHDICHFLDSADHLSEVIVGLTSCSAGTWTIVPCYAVNRSIDGIMVSARPLCISWSYRRVLLSHPGQVNDKWSATGCRGFPLPYLTLQWLFVASPAKHDFDQVTYRNFGWSVRFSTMVELLLFVESFAAVYCNRTH